MLNAGKFLVKEIAKDSGLEITKDK